ncbi:hypothetical protein QU749_09240 [Klebsiella pneumoniae]|nr:hypothetical protein [Klebsiella variicola]MCP5859883.1 hypothetical protein [Klebsiella pneumoniae]WJU14428.1 hypothetical protein QU749_09240 [Klebsiella pneumoniae]
MLENGATRQQVAEVIGVDENRAGAWVGKVPGYIVRQSHDILKIRAIAVKQVTYS